MNDAFYKALQIVGAPFAYRCLGSENIPANGPAIFVANHLGSTGPIQMILSVPVRLYPWVIAEMVDHQRAPQYLYDDFIHPAWHLQGQFGMLTSNLISKVSVRLLRGLKSVSVDRNRGCTVSPFRRSLALLREGKKVLVFPEDAKQPVNPETSLHPFLCGFILLGSLYFQQVGAPLPFLPAAVSPKRRTVSIGAPIFFQDNHPHKRSEIYRVCKALETEISRMYHS